MTDISKTTGQAGYDNAKSSPKINAQVVILSLIALITLFQTFQLARVSAKASSATVKSPVPTASSVAQSQDSGSSSEVPRSMVGGC